MIALLVGLALAATPGGFRVGPGQPQSSITLREAAVIWDPYVSETVLILRGDTRRVGGSFTVPFLAAGGREYRDAGLGPIQGSLWLWLGRRRFPWALGVEYSYSIPSLGVGAWGSVAQESLPGFRMRVSAETSFGKEDLVSLRLALGLWGVDYGWMPPPPFDIPLPTGELAIAGVRPITEKVAFVAEGELIFDPNWLTLRPMIRFDPTEELSIDLGLQLPISSWMRGYFSPQPLVQVRWLP